VPSVNENIRDLAISHEHFAQRFKTFESKKILAILNRADKEIRDAILKADITEWTEARFKRLRKQLDDIQKVYNKEIVSVLNADLKVFGGNEGRHQIEVIEKSAGDVINLTAIKLEAPSPASIWALAKKNPILMQDGRSEILEPYLRSIGAGRIRAINQSIQSSFALGESSQKAARRLIGTPTQRGAFQFSRNSAEAVTRTALNHLGNEARRFTYSQYPELIKGYEWVSTLDKRTSDICRFRDGRVWFYDETAKEKTSLPLLEGEVFPPAHINCRSTTTPIVVSWQELGIKADELPQGTRASMNGQVPERTTYYEWLQRQPAAAQREVLGPTRYNLWKKESVAPLEFHANSGRMLTLSQLKDKGVA